MEEYMAKRSLLALVFVGVFLVARVEAANVSFLVIETGLPLEAEINHHSELWESGLLDVFFEAGHIVTNAPVLRLETKPSQEFPDEAEHDLEEAIEGGAEYFVIALLDYKDTQTPQTISLKLFGINPHRKIFEQEYAGRVFSSTKEEYDNLKIVVRELVPQLNGR